MFAISILRGRQRYLMVMVIMFFVCDVDDDEDNDDDVCHLNPDDDVVGSLISDS